MSPVNAIIEGDELVIRLPINKGPVRSKSGKTLIVATTNGNIQTDILIDGTPVVLGVNAYRKEA
ncbi:MAG: hypothetical protein E6Q36_01280 [Chryseobacterium sp.]|nr:MAG: hypothetical protein E6Q36_01280 [Chryseobacterium sp.]